MAGRYNFNIPGRPDASIVNQGRITATSGGFAALVAPGVRNSGTITATLGTVALASGNSFTLDMYGDKLITLAVGDQIASKVIDVATGKPLKSLVSNTKSGTISANGGRVELTAAAARAVVDSVINTRGVIRANSIGHRNGMIVLNAATGGSKPAGAPAQTIKLAGTISAAGRHRGTTGGTVVVSGEHIKLANAKIDASGRRGGGKVLIGGDWGGGHPDTTLVSNASAKLENYTIATATTVSVDAATHDQRLGNRARQRRQGRAVVRQPDHLRRHDPRQGRREGGDGGFAETSGRETLTFRGVTDLSAAQGRHGNLLLDPQDIVIDAAAAAGISASLANSDVTVLTSLHADGNGNIELYPGAIVTWSTPTTLTLSAYHDISFLQGSKVANTGAGNLILQADNTGTGSGTVNFVPARMECIGNCGPSTTPNDPPAATIPQDPRDNLPPREGPGEGTVISLPSSRVDFSGSTGTVSIFYNPSGGTAKYQNPTNYLMLGSMREWRRSRATGSIDRLHAGEHRDRLATHQHLGNSAERLRPGQGHQCKLDRSIQAGRQRNASAQHHSRRPRPHDSQPDASMPLPRTLDYSPSSAALGKSATSIYSTSALPRMDPPSSAHSPATTVARSAMFTCCEARSLLNPSLASRQAG